MMIKIDLRSDTVTKPSPEMREAIANANVGDEVWGDDPTMNEFIELMKTTSGKPGALFMPSGTMSNQIAIAASCDSADEIICESKAHIIKYEGGAPAFISRVLTKCIDSDNGEINIDEIEYAVRADDQHFPRTKMICLENTHNVHGGTILSLEYIKAVSEFAKAHNLIFHCDGARLWNASAATGISVAEYCKYFDSTSLCLSKGLGAPVGSVLVATEKIISKAKRLRKMLGGGMRQTGILAAAAMYAIRNNFPKLNEDHAKAKKFAEILNISKNTYVDIEKVVTNIVYFNIIPKIDNNLILNRLLEDGIAIGSTGLNSFRAVFYLQISMDAAVKSADAIVKVVNELNER
jgi:threonine aldolase